MKNACYVAIMVLCLVLSIRPSNSVAQNAFDTNAFLHGQDRKAVILLTIFGAVNAVPIDLPVQGTAFFTDQLGHAVTAAHLFYLRVRTSRSFFGRPCLSLTVANPRPE